MSWLLGHVTADAPRGAGALRASRRLFSLLGDPQDLVPAVHVVGTAGKGSVVSMIAEGLVGGGHTVASHLSPHVYDVRERFVLDGRLPAWDIVLEAAQPVAAASEDAAAGEKPTFFAVTAALSMIIGHLADADFLVIEAGIGGRVDATNVLSRSDVLTVVTAIGLDHTDVLGSTVEAVAREKAAVLLGRSDVVVAPQPSVGAGRVVMEIAHELGVRVHEVGAEMSLAWPATAGLTAEVALGILSERTGRAYTPGLTRPPGRLERLEFADRRVVLDGAHNPLKLDGLAAALRARQIRPQVVVAAVGTSKDLDGCVDRLARLAPRTIATTFGSVDSAGPAARTAVDLAAALRGAGATQVIEAGTGTEAARAAVATTQPGDTIVVTGSFLHLAEVRDELARM